MLRNEADLVRALEPGTYTLQDIYRHAVDTGLADRPGGRKRIEDGREQYKRRVRTALYREAAKQAHIRRDGDRPVWVVDGPVERPRRALFVWLPSDPRHLELVLGDVAEVLAQADEPFDLIFTDPPYALDRGNLEAGYQRTYRRDHAQVVPGYVDVHPDEYAEFTARWIAEAGKVIRPGGYLAVVTGPQQAARVQIEAENAGLTYVNSIAVRRRFGVYTTRRFVHQHWRCTLMTNGPLRSAKRVFHRPEEMPRGSTGHIYAVDVWDDIPENHRKGLLRYDNSLHPSFAGRVIRATTNEGDLVGDPFLGGGSTAEDCLKLRRRFIGGDKNPNSLRYTMGRLLDEVFPAVLGTTPPPPPAPPIDVDAWVQSVLMEVTP